MDRLEALLLRFRYMASAADQIALSLFNFALQLGLIRALTMKEYGTVAFWIAVSGLAISIQNAVANTPLSVYLHSAPSAPAARLLESGIATVNVLAVAVLAMGAAMLNGMADGEWAIHTLAAGAAIPLYVAVSLQREFFRSRSFSRRDMVLLILLDAPFIAVSGAGVVVMLFWPERFSGLLPAFLVLSAGCAAGNLCARLSLRAPSPPLFAKGWRAAYAAILSEVSWSFLGVLAVYVQTRSYVYLVTGLAGLEILAVTNAVGMLYRPVTLFMSAWERSARPDLASLLSSGRKTAAVRALAKPAAFAVLASCAWFGALLFLWPLIDHYVFAGKFPAAHQQLLPWFVAQAILQLRFILGVALQAARQFRYLTYAYCVGGAATAAATAAILLQFDPSWVMLGTAVGEAVGLALLVAKLRVVAAEDMLVAPTEA